MTTDIDRRIFRAYDIRGLADTQIDGSLARRIGRAVALEAADQGEKALAVGADCRLSSPQITAAFTAGVCAAGLDVIELGAVPSPLVYFAASTLPETDSGVVVTASHNPPEYTGFKIVLKGEALSGADIARLYERVIADGEGGDDAGDSAGEGEVRPCAIVDSYLADVTDRVRLERPLKVVLDAGNSVCGLIAPALFRRLGCEVIELFCEPDGRFPNHHPDPAKPENMRQLSEAVVANGADLGLGFDGDGDRLGAVTESGQVIEADRILLLFVSEILARTPGAAVIFDIKCSSVLRKHIEALGGRPVMTPSGHSLIRHYMVEEGASLAGEMSGHIFFADRWYGFDDALYSGARLLEIVASGWESLSQLLSRYPEAHNTPELDIEVPEEEKFDLMAKVLADLDLSGGESDHTDGLRLQFADGWGLIRASNTSARLTARFEGDSPAALARIHSQFKEALLAVDERLLLPDYS